METLKCPYCKKELIVNLDWNTYSGDRIYISSKLMCQTPNHKYPIIFASDEEESDIYDNRNNEIDHPFIKPCHVSDFNRIWQTEFNIQEQAYREAEYEDEEDYMHAYEENMVILTKQKEMADNQITFFKELSFSLDYNILP